MTIYQYKEGNNIQKATLTVEMYIHITKANRISWKQNRVVNMNCANSLCNPASNAAIRNKPLLD